MKTISFGTSKLCPHNRIFTVVSSQGIEKQTKLSEAETNILEFLLEHPNEYFSKDHLLTVGWNNRPISSNSLPVAINNLRKIDCNNDFIIENLTKTGYKITIKDGADVNIIDELQNRATITIEQPTNTDVFRLENSTDTSRLEHSLSMNRTASFIIRGFIGATLSSVSIMSILLIMFFVRDWISITCKGLINGGGYCYTDSPPTLPKNDSYIKAYAKSGSIEKSIFISR